jgi:hypothetical protein
LAKEEETLLEVLINALKEKERMLEETVRKLMIVEIEKTGAVQLHMVEVVVYEMFVVHDLELSPPCGHTRKDPNQIRSKKSIIKSANRNCLYLNWLKV